MVLSTPPDAKADRRTSNADNRAMLVPHALRAPPHLATISCLPQLPETRTSLKPSNIPQSHPLQLLETSEFLYNFQHPASCSARTSLRQHGLPPQTVRQTRPRPVSLDRGQSTQPRTCTDKSPRGDETRRQNRGPTRMLQLALWDKVL